MIKRVQPSRRWIPKRRYWALLAILALFGLALYIVAPPQSERLGRAGIRLGLDLSCGTHLVYQADLSKVDDPNEAMQGVLNVIRRRIDAYGVTEPVIQKLGSDRILIQLPGIEDVDEAKALIGATAQLDFRELISIGEGENTQWFWVLAYAQGSDGQEKQLTGEYLKSNSKVVADQAGRPQVAIEFNDEGAILFEAITYRNWHMPLGIFLDNKVISEATVLADEPVQKGIAGGKAVITGMTLDESKTLAIQLNAGALPVPLEPIFEDTVSPTLGADFVRRSLIAGAIGLGAVVLFMVLYYRLPGVVASLALLVYGALVLAIFKLMPVTLTLTGIGGFILSIGMAVDANVLIIERMKEELRAGRTLGAAMDAGFHRAWSAIRDSNMTTFIACGILYWLAGTIVESPAVKGFAVTLFIGVAVSMFSAITVSRVFLRFFSGARFGKRLTWFGVETKGSK